MQSLKKRTEGFTIIEVMIVLVIAAVIILIVFLAVPALQRNSRNNQRKNDAARLAAATREWRNNNNNAWPTASSTTQRDEIMSLSGSLSFSDASSIALAGNVTSTINLSASPEIDYLSAGVIGIYGQASCSGNASVVSGGSIVVAYAIESGNTKVPQCLEG